MKSVLLVAAGLLLPTVSATAQPAPPPTAAPDAARMAQHRQDERRDLSIVLGLKPAQQPALDAWLAATRPPEGGWHRDRDEPARPSTTPEMLQAKQAHLAEMQRFETDRIAATKTFYSALDGRQREVFDALERLRHDRHGPHHGHDGDARHRHGGHDMAPPPADQR